MREMVKADSWFVCIWKEEDYRKLCLYNSVSGMDGKDAVC